MVLCVLTLSSFQLFESEIQVFIHPMLQCCEIEVRVTETKAHSSNLTSFGLGIEFLCQLYKFLVFFPLQSLDVEKPSADPLNCNAACWV